MIREDRSGYIVDAEGRVIGEMKNYDSISRDGNALLYESDLEFRNMTLDKNYKMMSEHDIRQDSNLHDALLDSKYQMWRFSNRRRLADEYDRVQRNIVDFDIFCRHYHKALLNDKLVEFLTDTFSQSYEWIGNSYYFDLKRGSINNRGGD